MTRLLFAAAAVTTLTLVGNPSTASGQQISPCSQYYGGYTTTMYGTPVIVTYDSPGVRVVTSPGVTTSYYYTTRMPRPRGRVVTMSPMYVMPMTDMTAPAVNLATPMVAGSATMPSTSPDGVIPAGMTVPVPMPETTDPNAPGTVTVMPDMPMPQGMIMPAVYEPETRTSTRRGLFRFRRGSR